MIMPFFDRSNIYATPYNDSFDNSSSSSCLKPQCDNIYMCKTSTDMLNRNMISYYTKSFSSKTIWTNFSQSNRQILKSQTLVLFDKNFQCLKGPSSRIHHQRYYQYLKLDCGALSLITSSLLQTSFIVNFYSCSKILFYALFLIFRTILPIFSSIIESICNFLLLFLARLSWSFSAISTFFPSAFVTVLHLVLFTLLLSPIRTDAVIVTEVNVMSINTGRPDYVIAGESVQLSCHYVLTDPYERVSLVAWKKDDIDVYFSKPNKRPIALSIFEGHVDYNTRDLLNSVTLINVDMSFAGQYSCRVITQTNESENTASMIVIVDSCKDSDWKTRTDMVNCVEEISFHCVGMYPKPSPACSIHNDNTDQYFAGETFDMIQQLPNGTYEIAMQRRYQAHNYTKYAGQLSFHCNLLVLMTSWRMGIKYKLFGESGCVQPPPQIHNGSFIIEGEQTCWKTPRENSRLSYHCQPGFELVGPAILICRNGSWISDPISLMSQPVVDMQSLQLRMPYCVLKSSSSSSQFDQMKFFTISIIFLTVFPFNAQIFTLL